MMHRLSQTGALLPSYLVLCVLLGGSSSGGALANAVLQLLGIAILWLAAGYPAENESEQRIPRRALRWLIALVIGWIGLQLVPLPSALWAALPGREPIVDALAMLGNSPGWRPLAIEWERAIGSALAFIPPLAVLALALRARRKAIMASVVALMAVTVVASAVGALQLAAGENSALYFYDITTTKASTGFFANSNHFSTLFNICAALAIVGIEPEEQRWRGEGSFAWLGWLALAGFFLVNTFLNRSLAGLALGFLVGAYCLLYFVGRIEKRVGRWIGVGIMGAAGLAAAAFAVLAPRKLTESLFFQTTDAGSRTYLWEGVWQGIGDTFPAGIGLGNFRWFYPRYEDISVVLPNYVNHAHNDWLEFLLEGGLAAVAILAALAWLLIAAWRRHVQGDFMLRVRLAAPYVAMLVIALHSLVDYPLRTATIAACGALALAMALRGLTFDPERLTRDGKPKRKRIQRHGRSRSR